MSSAKSDQIKGNIGGLKLSAAWTFLASARSGLEVATVIWKPLDNFYPFDLLLWGGVLVATLLVIRRRLVELTFAVPLADADATRLKTRAVLIADVGIACASFWFGLCLLASKRAGGLYPVATAVSGVLVIVIGFLIYRAIKRLAKFATPQGNM
jgi:hypothetical protein